jgi:hypothetical protein
MKNKIVFILILAVFGCSQQANWILKLPNSELIKKNPYQYYHDKLTILQYSPDTFDISYSKTIRVIIDSSLHFKIYKLINKPRVYDFDQIWIDLILDKDLSIGKLMELQIELKK